MKIFKKISITFLTTSLLVTGLNLQESTPNTFTNNAEAATNSIRATPKLIKKYGSSGFTTKTTVTRAELNKLANARDKDMALGKRLTSIALGVASLPVGGIASVGVGTATDILIGKIPNYADQLNATLKKSSAKKFTLYAHWRFLRHGADKYYVVSSFSAKPQK